MTKKTQIINFLLLILMGACWGPSFLFMKVADVYIPPITITATRFGLGSLILYLILLFNGVKFPNVRPILKYLIIASLLQFAVPFMLFPIAEESIDSSLASIILGSAPIITLIMAHFFSADDHLTKSKSLGGFLGFSGLLILIVPSLLIEKTTGSGVLIMLVSILCYATGFVFMKTYIDFKQFPSLTLPTLQLFISFLVVFPMAIIFENVLAFEFASKESIHAIIALGIIGTFGFVVYYKIIERTTASYASLVNYIIPIFGITLSVIFLHDKLTWNSYLGCAIIVVGVMIANGVLKVFKE